MGRVVDEEGRKRESSFRSLKICFCPAKDGADVSQIFKRKIFRGRGAKFFFLKSAGGAVYLYPRPSILEFSLFSQSQFIPAPALGPHWRDEREVIRVQKGSPPPPGRKAKITQTHKATKAREEEKGDAERELFEKAIDCIS